MSVLSTAANAVATKTLAATNGVVNAEGFDPGVTPNSDAPMFGTIQSLTGSLVGILIVASVAILAIGAVIAIVGRALSNQTAQKVGLGGFFIGLIGVAVLGSISGLVYWFSGQSLV